MYNNWINPIININPLNIFSLTYEVLSKTAVPKLFLILKTTSKNRNKMANLCSH